MIFYVLAQGSWRFWCSINPCDWPKLISDCVNSAAKTCQNRRGGSWVEPLPITEKISRYAWLIRPCITTNWQCLRWAVSVSRALPPCDIHRDIKCRSVHEYKVGMRTPRRMKKFYICADVSHTHTPPKQGTFFRKTCKVRIVKSLYGFDTTLKACSLMAGSRRSGFSWLFSLSDGAKGVDKGHIVQ